jgi:multicomponent Na+:H+ antiporter subunit F
MTIWGYPIVELAVVIAMTLTVFATFSAFARLVMGPSLPDRVVALDLIGILAVGLIAVYDIYTEQPVLLDAATVLALVAFLGTIAFASYVERRRHDE